MKPKTEEFLNLLLWSCDRLMHPTLRNLTDSFEAWAYRNGLLRQLEHLGHWRLIEQATVSPDTRLLRLTEPGRLHALGGRDPEARWTRLWDSQWRLVIFDVPMGRDSDRRRLRRYLRHRHFGCLQNSVWISPDSLTEEREKLAGAATNVECLLTLEARPGTGERDEEIVAGAWDCARMNRRYERYLKVLSAQPTAPLRDPIAAQNLRRWASQERAAWLEAVTSDPLLPECLLPSGYLGRSAWQSRIEALARARERLATFSG